MSFFDGLKKIFRKFFRKDEIKKISEANISHDEVEKEVLKRNDHEKYVENLKSEYLESSKSQKKNYKKLKFVNEIYVEPNIHDGTGFKKKTNH